MTQTATTAAHTPTLHIGERCRFGNLDWFPVWAQGAGGSRGYKSNPRARLQVVESVDADHLVLEALNLQDEPLALFEGTLFTAGYQHRALTRTVVLSPHKWEDLPVVCVEKGRWAIDLWDDGYIDDIDEVSAESEVSGQSAPLRIRHAMRGVRRVEGTFSDMFHSDDPQQERVWQEVTRYEGVTKFGNPTSSLVSLEATYQETFTAERTHPLAGQTGVIIAHGGYPVWLELFDHPETFAERFSMILESARLDSHGLDYEETPSRRARRFAHIVNTVALHTTDSLGEEMRNRSEPNPYVMTEATTHNGTTIHLTSLNAQHPLFA